MRPRTGTGKGSRAVGAASGPTPVSVSSAYNTPASSALLSTYTSDAEFDISGEMGKLQISALTSDVPIANSPKPRQVAQPPFRFMDLPYELRLEVYRHHFADTGVILDLDPDNYKRIHKKLGILRTCRTVYSEASYLFFSTHPIRIFPTHPRHIYKGKRTLLSRLKPGQRGNVMSLDLRFGPGWGKPPRSWAVKPELGLADCVKVRKIAVFVEFDPGNEHFKPFRNAGFYEGFSKRLLEAVLDEMPWVDRVEFDAWPSVKKSGAMMRGLLDVAEARGLKRVWGPDRGWTDADEEEPPEVLNLNAALRIRSENPTDLVLQGASIEAMA